ncbi:MAG TPA: hypothetical protein VHO70_09295, partial [Chitinispirillaceae bacterium]|nr:hypothetical protein [Chitinispirillaceae bacterium]
MDMDKNDIHTILTNIVTVFSDTACSTIEAFFRKKATVEKPWSSNRHIEINSQYVLVMGGASRTYQSILTVGVNIDTIIE